MACWWWTDEDVLDGVMRVLLCVGENRGGCASVLHPTGSLVIFVSDVERRSVSVCPAASTAGRDVVGGV